MPYVGERRLDRRRGALASDRAQPRRRLEQLRGLAPDDLEVARLVDRRVVAVHQLQHLALGDGVGRVGEHLHHAHAVRARAIIWKARE